MKETKSATLPQILNRLFKCLTSELQVLLCLSHLIRKFMRLVKMLKYGNFDFMLKHDKDGPFYKPVSAKWLYYLVHKYLDTSTENTHTFPVGAANCTGKN